jgi:hypothetical protein
MKSGLSMRCHGEVMYRYAIMLLLLSAAPSAYSQTVGFDLSGGNSFTVGQVVDLTVDAYNLPNGLTGGSLDLQFNAAVLDLQSVSINPAFDVYSGDANGTPPVQIDNTAGTANGVDFFAALNPSLTGNSIDIATFQFVAEGTGTSGLTLAVDSVLGPFFDGNLNEINAGTDFTFLSGQSVSVGSAVAAPEIDPLAAMSGLTLLLGGVAVLRGRRKAPVREFA